MKRAEETLLEYQEKFRSIADPRERVRAIADFAVVYGDCYGDKIVPILEQAIDGARAIDDKIGVTLCLCNLVFTNRVTGGATASRYMPTLAELTRLVEEIRYDEEAYPLVLNMVSYFHWFRGEFETAFNLAFESLKAGKKSMTGIGWNNFGLGVFYFDTKDLENSGIYFKRALETFTEIDHEYGKARATNGLASIAIVQNRIPEAIPLLEYSGGIYRKMGHHAGLSRVMNDMGLLERINGNFPKSIDHLRESIDLRREIDHLPGLVTSYTELGETYLQMKDYAAALDVLQTGLGLAQSVNALQKEMRIHKLLYDAYKELKQTELALEHFEKYFEVKSRILSDEAANNIKRIQTRFEKEKSEKEAEFERLRNMELKKANAIIEQKNKDITDSINYAKRIQLGILPPKATLDSCLKDHFVLYQPKDIVSGDFYWVAALNNAKGARQIAAAIDCTGHGVPGAFMSMLGNTLLNQTLNNPDIRSAADILDYLNRKLPENLKATGDAEHIRDGMDMSLCIFDFIAMRMEFAGANNPCWVIRDGAIVELKADKQPVSASTDGGKPPFTDHVFDLRRNDMIYLFTDGFADQFGGPNEKKFGYKRFRELLIQVHNEPSERQKELLHSAFEVWRGEVEQVDDVCVIGVRI